MINRGDPDKEERFATMFLLSRDMCETRTMFDPSFNTQLWTQHPLTPYISRFPPQLLDWLHCVETIHCTRYLIYLSSFSGIGVGWLGVTARTFRLFVQIILVNTSNAYRLTPALLCFSLHRSASSLFFSNVCQCRTGKYIVERAIAEIEPV